jgi:hypothetical protein
MALWGKADKIFSPGTLSVDYTTLQVTGSGTSFTAASVGDVISIGVGKTFGEAVIAGIASTSVLTIATARFLNGEAISDVEYAISQKPKYTLHDSHYEADEIYGVDGAEAEVAKTTQYSVEHGGWVGIKTYIDMHGELRVKTETLVAMDGISGGTSPTFDAPGDADDDEIFVDAVITILSGPDDAVGIGTTENAVFVVEVDVVPSSAELTYQWFEDTTELSDDAEYDGTTTPILTVANDSDKDDGREYSVVITSGDVSVTSGIATITYE